MIRASFVLYNKFEDAEAQVEALASIANNLYSDEYVQDAATREFVPVGWGPDFGAYLSWN